MDSVFGRGSIPVAARIDGVRGPVHRRAPGNHSVALTVFNAGLAVVDLTACKANSDGYPARDVLCGSTLRFSDIVSALTTNGGFKVACKPWLYGTRVIAVRRRDPVNDF